MVVLEVTEHPRANVQLGAPQLVMVFPRVKDEVHVRVQIRAAEIKHEVIEGKLNDTEVMSMGSFEICCGLGGWSECQCGYFLSLKVSPTSGKAKPSTPPSLALSEVCRHKRGIKQV